MLTSTYNPPIDEAVRGGWELQKPSASGNRAVYQDAEVEGQLELLHPAAQDRGADDTSSCGVIIGATVSPFLGPAFLSWEHALLHAQNIEISLRARPAVGQQCAFSSGVPLGLYPAAELGSIKPFFPTFPPSSTLQ